MEDTSADHVKVLLNGNLLLPQNVTQVQAAINATQNPKSVRVAPGLSSTRGLTAFQTYATPWIYISGSDVEIEGPSDQAFGGFYGFGEQWWHAGNRVSRPHHPSLLAFATNALY